MCVFGRGESDSIQKNAFFFNFILLAIVVIVHAGKSMNPQHHCEAVLTFCGKKCYSAHLNNTVMPKCLKTNQPRYFLIH